MTDAPATPLHGRRIAAIGAGLFVLGLGVAGQGGLGLDEWFGLPLLLVALCRDGGLVLAWWASAAGYGALLEPALQPMPGAPTTPGGGRRVFVRVVLGAAALLLLGWTAGVLGALSGPVAYVLLILGWALLAWHVSRRRSTWHVVPPSGLWCLAAWPAALLLGAAAIAPGVLWQPTEAGGYDVLSYHLQLPKEWIAHGAIVGLEHNVYSYMPNGLEAVYAQLGAMRGSMIEAATAAQLLHASFALLAAVGLAGLVAQAGRDRAEAHAAGALAGALYLSVPWTLVTGSLAYNEQAAVCFGVAAFMIAFHETAQPTLAAEGRRGTAVGLLLGAALFCKLTAVGFVAVPAGLVLLVRGASWKHRAVAAACASAVACAILAAWMVRNATWTGSPTFPLLSGAFGAAHWSVEQVARWDAAHTPGTSLGESLSMLFSERGLLHAQFAYVLWPLAAAGAALGLSRREQRVVTACWCLAGAAGVLFWLLMTHHQSRFLIPLLIPACVLIGLAAAEARPWGRWARLGVAVAAVAVLIGSHGLYVRQLDGRAALLIDQTAFFTDAPVEPGAPPLRAEAAVNALPEGARVYAEAFATPFYVTQPMDYRTVWDASPLGEELARSGEAGALRWLREQGYTHVLIDWSMLQRWTAPDNYGYDPNVTPEILARFAVTRLRPAMQWPPGQPTPAVALYTVPDR